MRRVYYASGSFLTGDAIAAAVLGYADALTQTSGSDVIEFPIILPTGSLGSAALLIGPASQIASATEVSGCEEPIDEELVKELDRRALSVGARRPVAEEANSVEAFDDLLT